MSDVDNFEKLEDSCSAGNEFNGRISIRVSAIFVILIGSLFGAAFPVYASRHRGVSIPQWVFFILKYFGSGVIIATAFIHLLAPAGDALRNPCLTGPITGYPWVEGISLMTIFVLFFIELMAMRSFLFDNDKGKRTHRHDDKSPEPEITAPPADDGHTPGRNHLAHSREHVDPDLEDSNGEPVAEDYGAQMTAIFILEFGVIFHSVFVGLTLAVAGQEFNTLYTVIVFHQTFEGLGLGSRLADTPWPKARRWTPYILAVAYALSTPISIAIGLGLRKAYAPGSSTALMVNGIFDSISAGILIYTGLVELMAHEFMFSPVMRNAPLPEVLKAFFMVCLGAGLMALLGKWA